MASDAKYGFLMFEEISARLLDRFLTNDWFNWHGK